MSKLNKLFESGSKLERLTILEDEDNINDSKFSSCQSCGPTNCSVCGVNLDWEHLSDYDKEWVEN